MLTQFNIFFTNVENTTFSQKYICQLFRIYRHTFYHLHVDTLLYKKI